MLLGILISIITANAGDKFKGTLLGFIVGLLLSVVCFDLIPDAFQNSSFEIGIVAMLLGLTFSTILDGVLNQHLTKSSKDKKQHLYKAAIFMTNGVAIDNFPSGIALGSILTTSTIKGIQLALILFIHAIPEDLTIGYFLKESKKNLFTVLLLSIIASVPMGLGASIGTAIRNDIRISYSYINSLMYNALHILIKYIYLAINFLVLYLAFIIFLIFLHIDNFLTIFPILFTIMFEIFYSHFIHTIKGD